MYNCDLHCIDQVKLVHFWNYWRKIDPLVEKRNESVQVIPTIPLFTVEPCISARPDCFELA